MKKFKISTVFTIAVAVVLYSCTEKRNGVHKTESGIGLVERYEVNEGGMRYILYREIDGGLFIINTTKDSLETELARKSLSQNTR